MTKEEFALFQDLFNSEREIHLNRALFSLGGTTDFEVRLVKAGSYHLIQGMFCDENQILKSKKKVSSK